MRARTLALVGLLAPSLLAGAATAQNAGVDAPAAPLSAPQPDGAVTLKVSEKGTGVALGKAEIKIGSVTVFSDPGGVAVVKIPPSGDGVVTVSRKGFETLAIKFDELRPPGEYAVRLYPGTPDDEVIVVRGDKKSSSVSRTSVSIEEAAKVAPGGDPAQVVKLLPGVQSAGGGRGGGGQVVVQGSGPHDSRYFIDDLEVPFIFHSFGDLSVVPGDMLRSVEFESAGFGVEYGDATGGVITLRTKDEIPERAKTAFVLNIPFYSGVLYTAPLSDTSSLTVGIRRSYIDFFLREFLTRRNKASKDKSTNVTLSPYFSDAEVQYLKKNADGHTKVTLLGAYDGIKAVVPADFGTGSSGQASINFYTGFADFGVEHEQRLDKNWKVVTTPQLYYFRNTVTFNSLNLDTSTERFRVPTQLTRKLDKNANAYVGMDPDYTVAHTAAYAPVFRRDDPTFDPRDAPLLKTVESQRFPSLATWAAVDGALGPAVVTPGLRSIYNGETKRSALDPRLRARWALSDQHTLKGAVGQYSESPQPEDASAERGNPHLGFIRSNHYVLGVDTKWNDSWATDISVYYKTGKGLIGSDPKTVFANKGAMRSRGFETLIRRNLTGRLFGWLAYTYSKTEERPSDLEAWRTATYDQTHVLTVVGDYKLTGTWDVGGRFAYHTGSTYDTVEDSVYNANIDRYEARPTSTDINNGRLPPAKALTAYFNHDFLYDAAKLALRFGVEQYWYTAQVDEIQYNFNYTKAEKVTSLTTVPFLELKGEL